MNSINLSSIPVNAGGSSFFMNSAVFTAETDISEISLINGEADRTIAGKQPCIITLEGKILPCDKDFFKELIASLSGNVLSSVTIDGTEYQNMVMTKGICTFSQNSFVGKCVIVLKKL